MNGQTGVSGADLTEPYRLCAVVPVLLAGIDVFLRFKAETQ